MSASDDRTHAAAHDLVVIGSSAGGVEALSILVGTLPPDFPAPVVLAQHLDPSRPSILSEILERRTNLIVELVQSRNLLEPGKIYVVPANHHVAIQDGHVEVVSQQQQGRPKPSVNRLLSTAAAIYGERLIAVILTGSGSDGASGAIDVKEAGGTVIIQSPQTARYPSMPLSLPPTLIDFEADIEHIGPLMHNLLMGVEISPTEKSEDLLRAILERVNRQANIDFRAYKASTVLRRIGRRMTVTYNSTIRDYATYLETHPEEVGELVQALLINVTQFFRDPESFDYLRQDVLPKLLAQARTRDRVLRIWSAGCSSGEEPYSLAMMVADLLGPELPQWSIKIFATDLDEAAISFARLGVYPESLLKVIPQAYRERFFERSDQAYRITKTLRQMVIFGQQDLSRSAPFPRVDLVLCRNVLIYFTPELQDYVLNQFAFSLRPNSGYLFLGKAENIRPAHSYFELINKQWKIYHCIGENVPVPRRQVPTDLRTRLQAQGGQQAITRAESGPGAPESSMAITDVALLLRLNDLLLRFLPVGVVVIDRSYQVITMNTPARRLLGLRDAGSEQDFLHAVRGVPYGQVRAAIDGVFRDRNPVTLPEVFLDVALGGTGHYLCLTIAPMQADGGISELSVISVTDVTEQVQNRKQLETAQAEQDQLVAELGAANNRLSEMNKELIDANEELQVANEEMMLTYEELQATNEEFEATNEELQATNEELETNNEEMQATNEELQTTNDELRARTAELQELASMLESDRGRFAEMIELAPFHIMVLRGPHLIVEAFNPRYARMMEGHELHRRPLLDVTHYFWQANAGLLVELAQRVYDENAPRTSQRMLLTVPGRSGDLIERYFIYMLVPTHDRSGAVDGVAIYANDVTEQRAQEVLEERERLQLIFQHAEQLALGLYDVGTMELVMATPQYLQLLGRAYPEERQSFLGSLWYESAFIVQGEDALQLWKQARESSQPVRLPEAHLTLPHDTQETVWNWSLVPIMDPMRPDQIRYMMAMAIEITEEVHAREEAERLDHLKDEFLSLASHELRTPLTSLIGNAYIMERLVKDSQTNDHADSGAKLTHYVGSIRRQLERLNVLIEDLIDVSRLQSGKYTLDMERVEMIQVVRQAVDDGRLIKDQPPIVVDMPADDPLPVWGDRVRLMQVLLNLLQNALTYAADSPRIDVRVRHENDPASDGQIVRVEVQDYGPGIAPEDQSAIFSRFYQAGGSKRSSHRGLGLGLFICKELVEQHRGSITVHSRVGQGSTFVIELPLYNG